MADKKKGAARPVPPPVTAPKNWPAKIEKAKQAREEGLEARKGKPATFRTSSIGQ